MIIAESAIEDAEARAFARARGAACELFRRPEVLRHLALLANSDDEPRGWTLSVVEPLFSSGRYGPDAGEWLFRVGLRVPREYRDEFLAWYQQDHLPILLQCPTWDGCRFVEAPDAAACQFFALHQLSDRAALASAERARSRATAWFMRFKRLTWFDTPFTRVLYRRVAVGAP
jgi:hypothetical protein